jgi:hypothetical protein
MFEVTPEEITARTVSCPECNAPVGRCCYRFKWEKGQPNPMPRPFHARRLKYAKKKALRDAQQPVGGAA